MEKIHFDPEMMSLFYSLALFENWNRTLETHIAQINVCEIYVLSSNFKPKNQTNELFYAF